MQRFYFNFMAVHSNYSTSWQSKDSFKVAAQTHGYEQRVSHLLTERDASSAFITRNPNGVWRIELKHAVPISLPVNEQIEQIKNYGFLAECNETLAVMYGHRTASEMMSFSAGNFPADLLSENGDVLSSFIDSGYQLLEIQNIHHDAEGQEKLFLSDIFGIVEDRKLTQIWGMQRKAGVKTNGLGTIKTAGSEPCLRQEAHPYQPVIDTMFANVAVLDRNGKIVAVNEAWHRFASNNGGDADSSKTGIGANYLEICLRAENYESDAAKAYNGLREILTGQTDYFTLEYPCHSPAGEERWFLLHATRLNVPEGGAVVSHLSITKRKKAEQEREFVLEELQHAYESSETALRMKDEFLSTISHDLKTPLASMLGWAKMLRSGKLDSSMTERGLETIERNAEIQSRLIEGLLDTSRILSGKIKLETHPVQLEKIIESTVEEMQPAAEMKDVAIEFDSEEKNIQALADPRRLEQILRNLFSAAIKFTPKGGRININLKYSNSNVQVSICDVGIGVPKEFLTGIFDNFSKQNNSKTRPAGSLDLDLTIVRRLIELHDGNISAESAGDSSGAIIKFSLPIVSRRLESTPFIENIVAGNDDQRQNGAVSTMPRLEGINLLIVDDDQDNLELLAYLFENLGANVETVNSVVQALAAFKREKPDLLISDIGMPEEDGYCLIEKIRNLEGSNGESVPAIALTAYTKPEDKLLALSKGFQCHLKKPVEPNELAQQVYDLLQKAH